MSNDKAYTVTITRTTEVEVYSTSKQDAMSDVKYMYETGDSSAELEDATYSVGRIRDLDKDGN